jgi:hypothetical protein
MDSAPFTFTYEGDGSDGLLVTGLASIRRQDNAIAISDALNSPNTASLTVGDHDGTMTAEPDLGANVVISTFARRVFTGTVVSTEQTVDAERIAQLKWHVDLVDPTWQFNRLIPFDTFEAVSASTVIADLVAAFAPDFSTGTHVQSGLPAITVEFDGSQNFSGCMDTICDLIGGGASWRVDYDYIVHCGYDPGWEWDEVPDELTNATASLMTDPPLRYGRDLTQVRTRVFVRGTDCFATVDDAAAQAALAVIMGGDGVIEAPVISRPELVTEAACEAYGEAVLSVFGLPIVTVWYASRDPKTASGKTVAINLPDRDLVGDFLIQSVRVEEIGQSVDTYPLFHVTASSVRFTIEDVLRQRSTSDITGNATTANRLRNGVNIHGLSFDGSEDIDLSPTLYAGVSLRVLT